MANLTAQNLGRYMQDPRSKMYGNMIQTGTSGAPVQSWQEGLARALQAPLGAYMQQGVRGEYETEQARAESKKREALASLIGDGGFQQASDILAQSPETSDLALSTALAHSMKEKQRNKVVYQQDAQGSWVGLPETIPESGEITPVQTGITGKMKGETDLEFYQRDPSGFGKYKALGNKGMGGEGKPYFTPVQTAQGVMAFNARTGRMEPVAVSGAPVIGSASDPRLQGEIAGAKSTGKETGKAFGEAEASLADMEATMPRLQTVVGELRTLGNKATYTMVGQGVNTARRQAGMGVGEGAVARKEYISKVDNEILPLLRQTFGAQFTQKEGESLKATLGDPNASPEEKNAVLASFIETKKGQIEALKRRTNAAPSPWRPGPLPASSTGGWGIRRLP